MSVFEEDELRLPSAGASAEEQRLASNSFLLAFSLYAPQRGYISGVQLGQAVELKNS